MSEGEELIQCPYNPVHMILKSRMQKHLVKCRQNFSCAKYVTCAFNATHSVPEPELEYHLRNCPDRKNVEKSVYVMEEPKPLDTASLDIEVPTSTENWDEVCYPGSSYLNVREDILQKNLVFRQAVGTSKSQKKKFLKNEVKRFGEGTSQPVWPPSGQ